MKMLPKVSLCASVIILVIAIVMRVIHINLVAGPYGWLVLSQVLAILAIAVKYVLETDKKTA